MKAPLIIHSYSLQPQSFSRPLRQLMDESKQCRLKLHSSSYSSDDVPWQLKMDAFQKLAVHYLGSMSVPPHLSTLVQEVCAATSHGNTSSSTWHYMCCVSLLVLKYPPMIAGTAPALKPHSFLLQDYRPCSGQYSCQYYQLVKSPRHHVCIAKKNI